MSFMKSVWQHLFLRDCKFTQSPHFCTVSEVDFMQLKHLTWSNEAEM